MAKKTNGSSNGEVVRKLYRALEEGDLETVDRLGGDAPLENVSFGQTVSLREDSEANTRAFSGLKIEVRNLVEDGDTVVVEGVGRGTHTGTLPTPDGDLAPTGRKVEIRFVDIYQCSNGRIRSGRFYTDRLAFFEQLGLGAGAGRRGAAEEAGTPAAH